MTTPPSGPKTSPFRLDGRVALVTGSSRGLGRAMAFGLGRAGAKVAFNYQNSRETAEKTFADFRAEGLTGGIFQGDVTDEASVAAMTADIGRSLGSAPDILVINATSPQPLRPIEQYDWKFHQEMLDFFVRSPFLLARAALPHMKKQRWGRIINITSEVFARAVPNFSAYVAAKGGQIGWTRSMASELAPHGITVNAISPGWIPVERHAADPQEEKDAYRRLIPAGRWGVPEDVAGAVVFFASDAASFITGQNLHVNGGMTTQA